MAEVVGDNKFKRGKWGKQTYLTISSLDFSSSSSSSKKKRKKKTIKKKKKNRFPFYNVFGWCHICNTKTETLLHQINKLPWNILKIKIKKIILLIIKTIPKKSRMSSFSRIRSIERTLTCSLKTDLFYRNMRVKVLASPQQIKKRVSRLRFSSCELHHSVVLKF